MPRTIGILAVILAALGALYFGFIREEASAGPSPSVPDAAEPEPVLSEFEKPREIPPGRKEYRSIRYGFSLLYPESLTASEFDEGGGAMTITFQNVDTAEGFQLFIVPHPEEQVTPARFQQDNPSGVRENMKDVTIDGAVGASFYSVDQVLGETAEVWFLKNGLLYEATTLRPLDSWLSEILATWEFFI